MKHPIVTSSKNQYYNLGSFGRPISTKSHDAQIWFNRGLTWSYGFNHQASAECFEQAILNDSGCAMAYWGLAYALGPNYNKPWEVFDKHDLKVTLDRTHRAALRAKELSVTGTAVEKALAHAIQFRFPESDSTGDLSQWNREYADAMGLAYQEFPHDLDVATLYADALMNLTPWALWDISTGKPAPNARTIEVKTVIETALTQNEALEHPGILHLYIHLMEMSSTPETAMSAADHLRGLVPDSGHLQHMPSHLDILCGDYRRAAASNSDAVRADEKYLVQAGAVNFYTLYRCHDYHFLIYSAMFAGQSKIALEAVSKLETSIPEELLRVRSPPMADWLEAFLAIRVHVLVRFGMWQNLIDLVLPHDQDLYCVTTAMMYYGKGVALASSGNIDAAEKISTVFREAVKAVKPSRTLFANSASNILGIARAMLDGELEYRRGNIDLAFDHLQASTLLSDALPYDEPWGWMQPTRHAYGALLLEQGHIEKAANVYAADLGFDDSIPRAMQHPNNVWALYGYHECLMKLGRNREAKIIEQQLRLAEAVADVPIRSSCFCSRIHDKSLTTHPEAACCPRSDKDNSVM
jgi:tetratricopeptide (TPR) repeat protein